MNHLEGLDRLNNQYYAMRHGQSFANIRHVVCGDPSIGTIDYGLTPVGREQVINSTNPRVDLDSGVLIYSSDFLRARETAELVQNVLHASGIILETSLRERYFGLFEGASSAAYDFVHKKEGERLYQDTNVESMGSVTSRVTSLIRRLEQEHFGKKILLVSHGDPLFFLENGFRKTAPVYFGSVSIMDNAEIKELSIAA